MAERDRQLTDFSVLARNTAAPSQGEYRAIDAPPTALASGDYQANTATIRRPTPPPYIPRLPRSILR
jgi:hypothetical protein